MLNETIQKTIETSMVSVYRPSLIILWLSYLIVLPLVTLIFKTKNQNWGRFWGIWFFTNLIVGIVLIFMVSSPSIIESFMNGLSNIIKTLFFGGI